MPPEVPATPAEEAAFRPRLEKLAKTRVPIPNWRTSFPREASAVTNEQAVNEVCASCHRRTVTEFRQFSHHPLFEDRVGCTDCHDPHHARDGRMLKKQTIAETCLQCHENVRGPFVFEHEPVKAGGVSDDCLECHRPHGAPNRKLEVMFSRGLCLQCHVDIQRDPPHQARGGDCWRAGCHVAVHGSNHSFLLFRE
jgi:DmsE family decaheme c-type cytochrome